MFSTLYGTYFSFQMYFKMSSAICFNLNPSKILLSVKLSLTQAKILDPSKLKEFADNYFKFDENGRKFSIRVENTVGKGEIAYYKQFLLFQQFFSKVLYCRHMKTRACLGKG